MKIVLEDSKRGSILLLCFFFLLPFVCYMIGYFIYLFFFYPEDALTCSAHKYSEPTISHTSFITHSLLHGFHWNLTILQCGKSHFIVKKIGYHIS